jgi:hypothetical protein
MNDQEIKTSMLQLQRLKQINLDPIKFFERDLKENNMISPEMLKEFNKLNSEVYDLMCIKIQRAKN